VELGGQSIFLTISKSGDPTKIDESLRITTTENPKEDLAKCIKYFQDKKLSSIGIGSFGPVDLNPSSETYVYITTTPKKGYRYANILNAFKQFGVPVDISTDVNVAALAEVAYGGHGDISSCCYITVGTGIGVGIVIDGKVVTGLLHPEAGHFYAPKHPKDTFKGKGCPFHKTNCTEGLAATGALAERLKITQEQLPKVSDANKVWNFEAFYLAHLCSVLTCVVSPQVIVIGGGVLKRKILFPKIREEFKKMLNGYLNHPKLLEQIDSYIVPSKFNDDIVTSGAVGCLELARRVLSQKTPSRL